MMRNHGPATQFSTYFMERNHQPSMSKQKRSQCRKNSALSMAKNYQLALATNGWPSNLLREEEYFGLRKVAFEELPPEHKEMLNKEISSMPVEIIKLKTVYLK